MIRTIALLSVFGLGLQVQADEFSEGSHYTDNREVLDLAASGRPIIQKDTYQCRNGRYKDQLGIGKGDEAICIQKERIPFSIYNKIRKMEEDQLQNRSDYDTRITKLYVFRTDFLDPEFVTEEEVDLIAEALLIPSEQRGGLKFDRGITVDFLSELSKADIGGEFIYTGIDDYISELFDSPYREFLKIQFGGGVELYPGGGFFVTHKLLVTEGYLIYVKRAWWDA